MKNLFKILRAGLVDPRYFVDAFKLRWRHLLIISLLASLMMTLENFRWSKEPLDRLTHDLNQASQYLPNFRYHDQMLYLEGGEAPLYYQSDSFQLVIDPSIKTDGHAESIPISFEQAERISHRKLFNLFLFKDQVFVGISNLIQPLPNYEKIFTDQRYLEANLSYLDQHMGLVTVSLFISLFVASFFRYVFEILLISLMAAFYNYRLTEPIPFKQRVKLVMVLSFVPIFLAELINLFIPGIYLSFTIISLVTLFLLYYTFKSHTQFIMRLVNTLDHMSDDEKKAIEKYQEKIEKSKKSENDDQKISADEKAHKNQVDKDEIRQYLIDHGRDPDSDFMKENKLDDLDTNFEDLFKSRINSENSRSNHSDDDNDQKDSSNNEDKKDSQ